MKIAATVLVGKGIGLEDAVRSAASFIDVFVFIHTATPSTHPSASNDVAARMAKLKNDNAYEFDIEHEVFDWRDDFSMARNFALGAAAACKADVVMTLDTDERMHETAEVSTTYGVFTSSVRDEILSNPNAEAFYVKSSDGEYSKERFFRLPMKARWEGRVHEAIQVSATAQTLMSVTFSEVPKTRQQYKDKFTRDIQVLSEVMRTDPNNGRWWFYLGESWRNLEQYEHAYQAYDNCSRRSAWSEEAAWACYQGAQCLVRLGNYSEARSMAVRGLEKHPGISELAWMAGYTSYQLGQHEMAIQWSTLALVFSGANHNVPKRIGFRDPPVLHEGPYDILRWAHKALGNMGDVAGFNRLWERAKRERLGT